MFMPPKRWTMEQVSRSRTEVTRDETISVKSGSVSAANKGYGPWYYHTYQTSASDLPGSITIPSPFDITVSLSGITVDRTLSGGVYYYYHRSSEVVARVKSMASDIISKVSASIMSERELGMATTTTFRLSTGSRSMSDIVTKEFQKLSKQGHVIMTPCSKNTSETTASMATGFLTTPTWSLTSVRFDPQSGGAYTTRKWFLQFSVTHTAYTVVPFGVTDIILGAIRSQVGMDSLTQLNPAPAINSAFQKVYQAELDVPVIIAEANKTLGTLEKRLRSLNKIISNIRKIRLDTKSAKSLSGLWLEYRYAWSPLVADIRTALKLLATDKTFSPRRTFRGWDDDGSTSSIDVTYSSGGYTYRTTGTLIESRIVRAGVLTSIDLPSIELFRDYGLLGGPGVVWELIPYSFVVDWFVNISGFLGSINPTAVIKSLGSWSTQVSEKRFSGTIEVTHVASGVTKHLNYSDASLAYVRTPNVSSTFFNIDVNINTTRVVDAISLLVRRLR